MKTQHLMAGILAIFLLSGYVLGQNGWTDDGNVVRLTTTTDKVGIGTTDPQRKLHVVGSARFTNCLELTKATYGDWQIIIDSFADGLGIWKSGIGWGGGYIFAIDKDDGKIRMGGDAHIDGSVGIGTPTIPSGYKLAVDGKIIAEEVQVEMSGSWPDHVFADGYRLMPLREVADYIKTNRHLPDMPSAAEVEENGVSLGEMQARLLQKVEELTLYVIDLKKENEALKARGVELEKGKN